MATLKPIRIGDTFQRVYKFYDPIELTPTLPDLTSPVNLTGITITWILRDGSRRRTYGSASGVTVTPLLGTITIEIEKETTKLWAQDVAAESYLEFLYTGGNVITKCHQRERVMHKESLET